PPASSLRRQGEEDDRPGGQRDRAERVPDEHGGERRDAEKRRAHLRRRPGQNGRAERDEDPEPGTLDHAGASSASETLVPEEAVRAGDPEKLGDGQSEQDPEEKSLHAGAD